MNHLALTMLVSVAFMVVAEPSPQWVYKKIHLLSDEESSPGRVKKFEIPSSNATQQNQTSKSNSPQNTTLDTHGKNQIDNQTDAVAKLYSFLKFTSGVKDNTTALKNASSEDSAALNRTNPVADTANREANSTGEATLVDNNVSGGTSAGNGSASVAAAFDSQQTPPAIKITAPFTSQTPSAQSSGTSLGIQGVALAGHSTLDPGAGTASPQTFRSNVPVRPLGFRANVPQYPNSYFPGHVPVPISQSRSYVATWPQNTIPNNKAVFRALVPVPKSYARNRAVLRSPVPRRPMVMPNRAMVGPAMLGQRGYMANHAVLRSPIPGQPRYAVNRAGMRSPIPGRATFVPNHATLRHTVNRYVPNRGALRSPIPGQPYAAYFPRARAFNFPKSSASLVANRAKHNYTPYRGPMAHSTRYIPHLPYARRRNIPYLYPLKSSTPFLAPGQKRAYVKANNFGHRSFARVARPAYTRTQVPARPLALRG